MSAVANGPDPLPVPSLAGRCGAYALALGWCAVLAWVWVGSPAWIRIWGLAWALLGVWRPVFFTHALAFMLPWFCTQPGGHPMLVALEMALIGPVVHDQLRRAFGLVRPRPRCIDPWLLLFIGWSWVTVAMQWRYIRVELAVDGWRALFLNLNHYVTSPTFGLQAALKMTLAWGFYQMMRDAPWPAERLRRLFAFALAGLALAAVIGVLDFYGWISLEWLRPTNVDRLRQNIRSLQSFSGHPGWFAEYVAVLAPAALALGLRAARPWPRRLGLALAVALVPVQLLTAARGGWLALGAGYATVVLGAVWLRTGEGDLRVRLRRLALAGVVVGAALVLLVGVSSAASPLIRQRLEILLRLDDRTTIWQSAWQLGGLDRLAGIGLGFYYTLHSLIFGPGHPFNFLDKGTAHNTYLHILTERGAIGLALFLIVLAMATAGLWRAALAPEGRRASTAPPREVALALLGGLAAFVVYGVVQYMFYLRVIELWFWIMLAVGGWAAVPERRPSPRSKWGLPVLLAASAVLFCARWDLLKPYEIHIGDENDGDSFLVGGASIALVVPPTGTEFELAVAAGQPFLQERPQTISVRFRDRVLAEKQFVRTGLERIRLTLPADRRPGERLVVEAAHVWRPLIESGLRHPPVLEVGVLYRPLEPVGPSPSSDPDR